MPGTPGSTVWDALMNAPLDRLLLVVGLALLILSLFKRFPRGGSIHTDQRKTARIIGGVCLAIGIVLAIATPRAPVAPTPTTVVQGPTQPSASIMAVPTITPIVATAPVLPTLTQVPPTLTPLDLTATPSRPTSTPTPKPSPVPPSSNQPSTSAAFVGTGPCSAEAVNRFEDLDGTLDAGRWYVLLIYDNTATPPWKRGEAKEGPGTVSANAQGGQRAWECIGVGAAKAEALRTAQSEKARARAANTALQVFGPDGNELP
jgi:hypothetical protein